MNIIPRVQLIPKPLPARLLGKDGRAIASLCPEEGQTLILFLVELPNILVLRDLLGEVFLGQACAILQEHLLPRIQTVWGGPEDFHLVAIDEGLYLVHGSMARPDPLKLPEKALILRLSLIRLLMEKAFRNFGQFLNLRVGYAMLDRTNGQDPEAGIKRALFEAQRTGLGDMEGPKLGLLLRLRSILEKRQLSVVYQPVINLSGGGVLGWEALAQGPEGTLFHDQACLFAFAEDAGEVTPLARLRRELAVRHFGDKAPDQKLFLDVHRCCLVNPKHLVGEFASALDRHRLTPADIVLEFSCLDVVRDFPLSLRGIERCRERGFKVALDDFGPDRLGLSSLAEIRPKFLKLDMSLLRMAQIDTVKQALLETYVAFANRIGCEVIAKDIQTKAELDVLNFHGVRHGQGAYLAQPNRPKRAPSPDGLAGSLFRRRMAAGERLSSIVVGDLAEPILFVSPDTSVDVVREAMTSCNEPLSAVVVVEDERPVGLIMSHHLDRNLSEEFGRSVYFRRPVTLIMDSWPLIVDASTPVELAAQQAMLRDKQNIFDYVIVTEYNRCRGVVSVQKLLDTLAAFKVEMAKGANPLTGLPGNLAIEQEIERLVAGEERFAILYADLDNFKVYNDVYGFVPGDGIILLLGRVLTWAIRRHGTKGDFLGHVGGDDFVGFTTPARAERVCKSVVRVFGRLVRAHFTPKDLACGFILGHDRRGQEMRFPLTTVSLGILECAPGADPKAIAQASSATKAYAKTIQGHSYVQDRRCALQVAGECHSQPQGRVSSK